MNMNMKINPILLYNNYIYFLKSLSVFNCKCNHEVDICGFQWKISTAIDYISIKCGSHINVSIRMNSNYFSDSSNTLIYDQMQN